MPGVYKKLGLQFQYPENWTVDDTESSPARRSVAVHSPGGAFWSVTVCPAGADPGELAQQVLGVMRAEYDNLDAAPREQRIADHALVGFDISFYCLDLTNTALVRALATPAGTYVLHCQAEDREYERVRLVFDAMTVSLLSSL